MKIAERVPGCLMCNANAEDRLILVEAEVEHCGKAVIYLHESCYKLALQAGGFSRSYHIEVK